MPRITLESNWWLAVIVMHYGTATARATTYTLLTLARVIIIITLITILTIVTPV
jgi:hypothetical protein